MRPRKWTVGVIGAGLMGTHHMRGIRFIEEFLPIRLYGICDIDREKLREAKEKYGPPYATVYPEELIKKVDIVFVAVPPTELLLIAEMLHDYEKPAYIEPPVGTKYEETLRIFSYIAEIPHQIGFVLRHSAAMWKVKEFLDTQFDKGRTLRLVHFKKLVDFIHIRSTEHMQQTGRGIVWNKLLQEIDLIYYLLGDMFLKQADLQQWEWAPAENFAKIKGGFKYHEKAELEIVGFGHKIPKQILRHIEIMGDEFYILSDFLVSDEVIFSRVKGPPDKPRKKKTLLNPKIVGKEYVSIMDYPAKLLKYFPRVYSIIAEYRFLESIVKKKREPYPNLQEALVAHQFAEKVYQIANKL